MSAFAAELDALAGAAGIAVPPTNTLAERGGFSAAYIQLLAAAHAFHTSNTDPGMFSSKP